MEPSSTVAINIKKIICKPVENASICPLLSSNNDTKQSLLDGTSPQLRKTINMNEVHNDLQ